MIAKAACKAVTVKMAANLLQIQIGFGDPRSTEAAVRAARSYVTSLQPDQGVLKLDLKNAFNTLSRDNIFSDRARTIARGVKNQHHFSTSASTSCCRITKETHSDHTCSA
jgi:hypothetical protein